MRARRPSTATVVVWLALAHTAAALGGCSIASVAPPAATPRIFDLTVAASTSTSRGKADWQLVVNEPTSVRALEGDRIAVRTNATEISYFTDAVWADRLPRLVQARLIGVLAASHRFRAVGNGRDKLDADLALAIEIEAFEIEVGKEGARARVALSAKLIDERRGAAVAVRRFAAESHATKDDAAAGVAALSAALSELAPQLLAWSAAQPVSRHLADAASASPAPAKP